MHVAVSHDISCTFFMNTDSSSMSLFSFQVFAGSSKTNSCLMMNETPKYSMTYCIVTRVQEK